MTVRTGESSKQASLPKRDSSPDQPKSKPCVLYIMGCGRSGSTILDIVLGSHPEVVSVGELANVARRGWQGKEYCACGEPVKTCSFWSTVRKEWAKRTGEEDIDEYIQMQDAFERLRRWRALLKERRIHSVQFDAYATRTATLMDAILSVSKASVVVDSSKIPFRAFALSMTHKLDFYVIHLVRDGRGVVWSRMKAFKRDVKAGLPNALGPWPVWQTSIGWVLANLASHFVLRSVGPRGLRVKYEDFVACPRITLNRIGKLIQMDFDTIADKVEREDKVSVAHLVAGNRVRMSGTIQLKPDLEWQERLPRRARFVFWMLAWPMVKWLGYRRK